jgi:ferrous iron transport protein B
MHCHGKDKAPPETDGGPIVLVGNPNVGKSALFGRLTGRYVTVSNYPGTTVEVTRGVFAFDGRSAQVIDTPGIHSLVPLSDDERVARDILLAEQPKAVVLVADAKNLERALLLAVQLAEVGAPFVLSLNMDDEARQLGVAIDAPLLSRLLGVGVVRTVATRGTGVDALVEEIERPRPSSLHTAYDHMIEAAAREIEDSLPEGTRGGRSLALMLLAGDDSVGPILPPETMERARTVRHRLQTHYELPLGYEINHQRLRIVREIMSEVFADPGTRRRTWRAHLGRWAVHPVAGVPLLLGVLYLMYKFVGQFGAGTLVGLMEDGLFGDYINPWATTAAEKTIPSALVQDFFVGEYGIVTIALTYGFAIILPVVGTFFLAFSLLEDSGYLPRLAVMVNRPMKAMGLNGRAVLPMVLGLGCDTMATMTTRTLQTRKERIQVTLLLALAIPCSAQLGVILGILGGLGPKATLAWASVVLMTLFAVGYLSSRVIPGDGSDFIQELPPLRFPRPANIVVKTVARVEWYLKEVIPLFILGTILLFTLDRLGALAQIESAAAPLVQDFLGLPRAATATFIMGFLRRDYGAAGLFALAQTGQLEPGEALVALVVITLFIPCIANFFVIVKEHGTRTAMAMAAFIFPFALLVGGLLNFFIQTTGMEF